MYTTNVVFSHNLLEQTNMAATEYKLPQGAKRYGSCASRECVIALNQSQRRRFSQNSDKAF